MFSGYNNNDNVINTGIIAVIQWCCVCQIILL